MCASTFPIIKSTSSYVQTLQKRSPPTRPPFSQQMMAIAAACWICLGEELDDDDGGPLVRDCSCRGENAGYVHQKCLIEYAKMKSKQSKMPADFERAWHICPNCNQQYGKTLRLDLTTAFVAFAETTYPGRDVENVRHNLDALRINISSMQDVLFVGKHTMTRALHSSQSSGGVDGVRSNVILALRSHCEFRAKKVLSLALQAMKDEKMDGWIHMPPANYEYQFYKAFRRDYEVYALDVLGTLYKFDGTKKSLDIAIKHWGRAQVILKMLGISCEVQLNHVMSCLIWATARLRDYNVAPPGMVCGNILKRSDIDIIAKSVKGNYERDIKAFGIHDARTIEAGINNAKHLYGAHSHIEAERLMAKLTTSSRQVLGPDHDFTKTAINLLNKYKARIVAIMPHGQRYQALRYEADKDTYVVTGPIWDTELWRVNDGPELRASSELCILMLGCPVMCHGLKSSSHLNGKLGEAKAMSETVGRLLVHFQDKSLKPSSVMLENLRIVFDLPDEAHV